MCRGQAQDPPGGGRGAVDAEHLGAVPADGDHRGGGRAEQAHHLDPGYHGGDQVRPGGIGALGEGERRGDDGGVGVPGQQVGVVVLGAVAERAVDPGGLRDRCARAGVRQGGFGLAGLAVRQPEDGLDVRQGCPAQLQAELVEDE